MLRKIPLLLLATLLFSAPQVRADFGLAWAAHSSAGLRMDSPEASFSIRFTSLRDQQLRLASLYCLSSSNAPSYLLSLQEDKRGLPSGRPLAVASWVPAGSSWGSLVFEGITLKKGSVYHAVVEFDSLRGGGHPVGTISPGNYAVFAALSPATQTLPLDGGKDMALALLSRGKHGPWKDTGLTPVFMLRGADGLLQGQSYGETIAWPVYAGLAQAQVLHFNCGSTVSAIRVRVRKLGKPSAPLRLQIHKHDYHAHKVFQLYEADLAQASDLSSQWSWREFSLPEAAPRNVAPECYYFSLTTDSGLAESGQCADCYQVSGLKTWPGAPGSQDLTFDAGAHRSRAASRPGKSPWRDDFDADLNLMAVGTACEARERDLSMEPLPTPAPLRDFFRRLP